MIETLRGLLFETNQCNLCKRKLKSKSLCDYCKRDLNIINEKSKNSVKYIDEIYYSCIGNRLSRRYVSEFKYNNNPHYHREIANIMSENIYKNKIEDRVNLIIPIAIHSLKMSKRGYNQAELLARRISKITGIEFSNRILIKIKNTPAQRTLDSIKRRSNLDGAFGVKGNLKGKRILLIDDILTTGSTLKEAAKVLKEAGCESIIAQVFLQVKTKK